MTSTTTSTLSLVNTESGRGPPIEVEVCPVNTMSPSACTINIKNGPSGEGSARTATPNEHAAPQVQADSDDASHISINSSYLDSTHLSTDSSTSNYRPGLDSRRSSSSLASSINTVIHLGSSTAVDPTPTSQIAHGSILGSRSDSSHLLSDLVAKSAPNADPPDSTDSHGSKIQFHNVVRISGGISSSPKRKKASKQIPRNITIDSQRRSLLRHLEQTLLAPLWVARVLGTALLIAIHIRLVHLIVPLLPTLASPGEVKS